MKQFKEFGIQPAVQGYIGDKIKIDKVINKEIVVHAFKIEKSKYEKGSNKCLHLQVEFNDAKRVIFTGSVSLMDTIQKVPEDDFPFKTTIIKDNDRFEFS